MLRGPFLDRTWMGQNPEYETSDIVMLGLPFDGTVSYRSGSRFAPEQIRLASWGLEEYSPRFDKDLADVNFHDAGDLEFPLGNTYKTLEVIEQNVEEKKQKQIRMIQYTATAALSLVIVLTTIYLIKEILYTYF
jgi:agmatinase